jgi:subfamily B ATP-binding cassette protein MsbA
MSKKKSTLRVAFKEFIWPRKNILLVGLILIAISRAASLILPWQTQVLIDDIVINKDYPGLKQLLVIVASAILIQALTSFALTRLLSVEAQNLISKLRAKVQKHVLSLPISYFDNTKSGALVSRIMSDVEGVRNLIGTGLVQLIGGTITAIATVFILIRMNPQMTFFVLVPVIIFAVIALKAFGYIRPIFRNRGKINAEVTGRLTESLNGIRVIKGFNAEQQENEIFETGVERLFQNVKKSLTATALMTSSSTFLLGLASTGIMGIGGYYMIEGEMEPGEFISFTLYLGFMIAPIVQMSNIGSQLTEAFAGLDRTEELMNEAPENNPEERPIQLNSVTGDVKFENVSFAYEEDKEVVHEINFDAPLGSVTALVGTSGSGK